MNMDIYIDRSIDMDRERETDMDMDMDMDGGSRRMIA